MANNQGGVDPWANLGASIQQAKESSRSRNKEAWTAQRLMEEAALKKQERDREEADRKRREDYINTLPADVRMKAMSIPGYLDSWISANDPDLQKPEKPQLWEVGNALVNENGEVIYQGPNAGADSIMGQIAERQMGAEAMGLSPDDPAYKAYVLTGKMPREDQAPLTAGDKKAILDADDAIMTNQMVIDQLSSVLRPDASGMSLNDKAGSGATSGLQSWAARNDPTGFFDDARGEATTELQNIILNQALTSLKSIFGSAPTEGERQILVELQASIDKTPAERKPIIERAIRLANARLGFNKNRAESLRGGSYYKPGGSDAGMPDLSTMTDEELEAIVNGQ